MELVEEEESVVSAAGCELVASSLLSSAVASAELGWLTSSAAAGSDGSTVEGLITTDIHILVSPGHR
jgi:hypothetical protein